MLPEVEAKEASTIFEAAIQQLTNEIKQIISQTSSALNTPVYLDLTTLPIADHQKLLVEQQNKLLNGPNKLFYKRKSLEELQKAVETLQQAVTADKQLPPDEARRIAEVTQNLVAVAVSPSVTGVQLDNEVHGFKNVTSPLNKTNVVLAKLCFAVCVAALVVAFVVAPCLAFPALISKGLYAGPMLGGVASASVAGWCAGNFENESKSRPRFFQPRTMVEQAAREVASFTFNRDTFRR